MGQDLPAGPLAVYLHLPFCLSPCPYCSFFKRPWSRSGQESYLNVLLQEISLWKQRFGGSIEAYSIYLGGGTPSLLNPQQINEILRNFELNPASAGSNGDQDLEAGFDLKDRGSRVFQKDPLPMAAFSLLKQRDRGTEERDFELNPASAGSNGDQDLEAGFDLKDRGSRVFQKDPLPMAAFSLLKQRDRGTEEWRMENGELKIADPRPNSAPSNRFICVNQFNLRHPRSIDFLKKRERGTEENIKAEATVSSEPSQKGQPGITWSSKPPTQLQLDNSVSGALDFKQRFVAKFPPQLCWLKSKRPANPLPIRTLSWPLELQRSHAVSLASAGSCTDFSRRVGYPEITLEINPIQITPEYVKALKSSPVNRLSIGLQSCRDEALRYLGRRHTASSIPQRIRLLREHGYRNISLDLIYGLPQMSLEDLRRDLDAYLALEPQHISCYLLTLDEDSPLGKLIAEGKSPALPDDDTCASQYELITSTLRTAGFQHYEISNFARPGYAGIHNLSYWKSLPYLALGASAAGWLPPRRYQNPASLEDYQRQISAALLMPEAETLSASQEEADYLMMGLRLLEGIDLQGFQQRFGHPLSEGRQKTLDRLHSIGMIELSEERLKLSDKALFVSNAVIAELL